MIYIFPNFDKYEQVWTSLDMSGQDLCQEKCFLGGGSWPSLVTPRIQWRIV